MFAKDGKRVALVTSVEKEDDDDKKSSGPGDGVTVVELDSMTDRQVASGTGQYKGLTFDEQGEQLAFITNRDDYKAKTPKWSVHHWTVGQKESVAIASEGSKGIPNGWWIPSTSSQQFSEDGRRLFFDSAPIPEEVIEERDAESAEKDEDDPKNKVKLDVWHWQDPYLQPQQLLQAETERRRDYRAVYNIKSKRVVQLSTREIPFVRVDYRSKSNHAIAVTDMAYRKVLSWEYPGYQDTYLISLDSGTQRRVQERVRWSAGLSPSGKYLYWFDAEQRKWFTQGTSAKSKPVNVTAAIKHPLYNELHDRPSLPSSYGAAGWLKGDKGLLIYDRYDLWQVDPTGKQRARRLTRGREQKRRYRYVRLDRKERFVDADKPIVLSVFDEATKASGYHRLLINGSVKDGGQPDGESLILLDESVSGLRKAEASDEVLFTRSTFEMCPDLWASDLRFKTIDRISDINPQQDEYAWGSAELVHWKTSNRATA